MITQNNVLSKQTSILDIHREQTSGTNPYLVAQCWFQPRKYTCVIYNISVQGGKKEQKEGLTSDQLKEIFLLDLVPKIPKLWAHRAS